MQHNTSVKDGNGVAMGALGLAVAAALGAAIGLMFAPQSGEKTRKELAQKAESLAATFQQSRESIQKWLTDIFGAVNDQLEEFYLNMRGHILAAVDAVEDKKHFTQQQFESIVDDVIKNAAKGREWTEDKVEVLAHRFKAEWKEIHSKLI